MIELVVAFVFGFIIGVVVTGVILLDDSRRDSF